MPVLSRASQRQDRLRKTAREEQTRRREQPPPSELEVCDAFLVIRLMALCMA